MTDSGVKAESSNCVQVFANALHTPAPPMGPMASLL